MRVGIKGPCPTLRERFAKVIVIDVETVGLYGDPYAVGWAVFKNGRLDSSGGVVDRFVAEGSNDRAGEGLRGSVPGWEWVAKNPPPESTRLAKVSNRAELLMAFGRLLRGHKSKGFQVAADVPSPVEAGLVIECARLGLIPFEDSPYPLWDIASIMACAGMEPLKEWARTEREEPRHCPVADAIQSGRLLFEAIDLLEHAP